jgi:hypothetical protein
VSTAIAVKARLQREREQARRAKYEATEKAKQTRERYKTTRQKRKKLAEEHKPFIVWDGEQPRDTGYSLFGNSEGYEICHPGLSTKECLELILDTELEFPDAIHVGYGFNFDVSWILKDLPWRALNRLKKYNRCFWEGYQFEHIPHKWFSVKYGTINAKIFDVHSFFAGKLPDALADWEIGPWKSGQDSSVEENSTKTQNVRIPTVSELQKISERETVETFKKLRSEFQWIDMESIRVYMRLELKYTKQLMEKLREAFLAAGYLPRSWHGPGALATLAMRRHKIYDAMAESPQEVKDAARSAFFGGRFSLHLAGHIRQNVYFADRNSAYPYACTFLPNLAKGKWKLVTNPGELSRCVQAGQFGIFRIMYHYRPVKWSGDNPDFSEASDLNYRLYPLPKRSQNGGIEFPPRVNGWYWTPEAKLVVNDDAATFVAGWVFDEDNPEDRPFSWIPEYYRRRQLLKRTGNAAQYTLKIILNAIFGQCARRTGWDRKKHLAPRSHQLEFAGFITSHCRAALYDVAEASGWQEIVSIDTDGLLSLAPIPVDIAGDGLGEWKTDTYEEAIVWQSGMYALKKDGMWEKAKTRGIARAAYTPDDLVDAIRAGVTTLKLRQNKFLGYGLALNGQFEKNNTWIQDEYEFVLGGNGSRFHDVKNCDRDCRGSIHRVKLKSFLFLRMDTDPESAPHFLPWLDNSEEMLESMKKIDDITMFDTWDPEEWRP